MGAGGSKSYEASDPGLSTVGVNQMAAREAARAATKYLGEDLFPNAAGGSSSGAMSDSYAQAMEQDNRKNNWERMIAGIGSPNGNANPSPNGNTGNAQGW